MTYRPRIPDSVHERVERHTIGKRKHDNEPYITGIKLLINEEGEKGEWVKTLNKYCDEHNLDGFTVLNKIITQVIDEDGEANIKYKERLDLE